MYVTYAYYTGTYNGTQFPEKEDFQKAEREAETYIRYLTYLNGDIFVDKAHTDGIKTAVCAAAEARDNAVREIAEGGNVKSESKDGFSASFVTTRRDGETVDDYIKRCMYQAARPHLLPTGWLSRKAVCGPAHEAENDNGL